MKEKHEADLDVTKTLGIDQSSKKGKRLRGWFGWSISILIIGIVLTSLITYNKAEPVQFKTKTAERGDLTIIVTATGNLKPTNQVDVSSELSGIIKSVDVDYNDHVKVGQLLARLDTTKLEATVRKSKASLESARAKVLQAQATSKEKQAELDRMRKVYSLSGGKVPAKQDMDSAEAELERARANESSADAQVSQAQATLESDETNLTKATICSPINGVVLVRDVEPGQTVAASLSAPVLFTLAEDLAKMELHVDVDEADVGKVKKGQDAIFTVDAYPNRTFLARIAQVRYGSEMTGGVVTYKAVLTVDNSDLLLRPGMTATANITVRKISNAILVPNAAFRFSPPVENTGATEKQSGNSSVLSKILPHRPRRQNNSSNQNSGAISDSQQRVWTVRNGTAVSIQVTTGETDGMRTEITRGELQPGMALIVATMSEKK
ncbi:MAG: efflux RND transporter periplasmic adaptor subunit [Deltaproteobacteria bacterium]|nr:efflux RND transporter periplasmic adaptor subunit [Deltaproteobacteria bacterium]